MNYTELMNKTREEEILNVAILTSDITILSPCSVETVEKLCTKNDFLIHRWAKEHFQYFLQEEEVNLDVKVAVVPAKKLLAEGETASLKNIFKKAGRLGFRPCLREVAPQLPMKLLKELKELNNNFNLNIMAEPLLDTGGPPAILTISKSYDTFEIHSGGSIFGTGFDNDYYLFFI